jgi:hypothetical protein
LRRAIRQLGLALDEIEAEAKAKAEPKAKAAAVAVERVVDKLIASKSSRPRVRYGRKSRRGR